MTGSTNTTRFRCWLWLIRFVGLIVPRRLRADWRQEWEAELAYRETLLVEWDKLNWQSKLNLLWRSTSAFWDALWLQPKRWEDDMFQDLRYAVRMLLKHKGFTFIAILTLALGIGANTAIFSLINALFLRPLPVKSPHELAGVFQTHDGGWANGFSYPDYLYFRDRNTVFAGLAAYHLIDLADTDAREITGCVVSGNYFSLLGVQPVLGRFFLPAEDEVPGRNPVAVLSHDYWQRQLAGDPLILGKSIKLSGVAFTVIGIAPQGFRGAQSEFTPVDAWLPTMMAGQVTHREDTFSRDSFRLYKLLGRRKPEQTNTGAEAEMRVLAGQLEISYPATNKGRGVQVAPAMHIHPGDFNEKARLTRLLVAGVSCLLLIASVNLAGLLLVRGLNRRKELAIRLSLGASRGRIIRQLLTESLLLSLLGGVASLLVTAWATTLLSGFYTDEIRGSNPYLDLSLDTTVLGYVAVLSILTGLAFGLAPALQASRTNFNTALKAAGSAAGQRRSKLRTALLVAQIACSLILLVNAGLLLHSLKNVLLNPDFDANQVAFFRMKTNLLGYGQEKAQRYYSEVVRRLEALPGVQAVSFGSAPGPVKDGLMVQLPGRAMALRVPISRVAPRYFEALSIPLLQGRGFDKRDSSDKRRVVIVNEFLAQHLWPNREVVGMPLLIDGQTHEVVGVAKYSNYSNHSDTSRNFLFLPVGEPGNRLLVCVTGNAQAMLPVLRKEIIGVDPEVPISEELPLTEVVKRAFRPVRLASSVLSTAGLLALLLTALGLYGALAFAVTRRTSEIGIRMALGAQQFDIFKLVLGEGIAHIAVGIAVGIIGAVMTTQLLSTFLYGVTTTDPVTFLGVPVLLLAVSLAACYLPARRATKIDPLVALRYD